ncbi:MAG: MATE family efflux transporter [Deltaproteobacteria bacterium]|nr:MAG: MATE family efflux transporter [Deltaproteobacteria bacterium]
MNAAPVPISGRLTRREVLGLAIPATLSAVVHHAYRPLDQFFVQGLGKEAQGALGASTFVIILTVSTYLVISAGVGPRVGRATGAGDADKRREVIGEGLAACGIIAAGLFLTGLLAADLIPSLLGLSDATSAHAASYLRWLFLTGAALVASPVVDASFHAMGNTRLPMILQTAGLALNAVLNPLLIYNAGLGTAGAALATTIAQTMTVGIGLYFLVRQVHLTLADIRLGPHIRGIIQVGTPVAVSTAAYAIVYWALIRTSIAPLGDDVVAGLGIGFSALEAVTWPLYAGCSVAVSSIVGRRLGAREPEEAWRAVRWLGGPTITLGVLCAGVFAFAGPFLVSVFTDDPDAAKQAILYAAVLAWSQPFVAVEALTEGVLSGAGDTRKVLLGTVPYNLLRVPLAWALAFPLGLGAAGVWWAINLTTLSKALVKAWFVWRGEWAELELD